MTEPLPPLVKLLIVDDDVDMAEVLSKVIQREIHPLEVRCAATFDAFCSAVREDSFDMATVDYLLDAGHTAADVLTYLDEARIDLPVIIVSGRIDDDTGRLLLRDPRVTSLVHKDHALIALPREIVRQFRFARQLRLLAEAEAKVEAAQRKFEECAGTGCERAPKEPD